MILIAKEIAMRFSHLIFAVPFSLVAHIAAAAPATPEGAAALLATLQTYLGSAPGVVTVQPEGEVYGVKLDFAPLLAKLPAEGFEASITPLEFKLTDNGDGIWGVTEDQSITAAFKLPGEAEMSLYITHLSSAGTFDANLGAFSASTADATNISFTQTTSDPAMGMTTATYQIAAMHSEGSGVANATAGVDLAMTYLFSDISEAFEMPSMAPDQAPMALTARVASYASDATITGLRPQAIYQLLAFAVANPSPEAFDAGWPELKTILTGAIPLFDHMQTRDKLLGLSVASPLGTFGLAEMGIQIEANGVVADGMLREAFTLTGLTMPEGLVPDWAIDLVPQTLSLDVKVAGFDPASFAMKAMEMVDASHKGGMVEIPEDAFMAALLPKGTVEVTLAPGATTSAIYTLGYEGSLVAGPAMAKGHATVTMTGLAAVREAVKSAPEDLGMQAAPVLGAAEGIAKRGENGALTWDLELTEAGGLMVNGIDMAAMGGQ